MDERFVCGNEEIEKKRGVIAEIFTAIETALNQKVDCSLGRWGARNIFEIPIGGEAYVCVRCMFGHRRAKKLLELRCYVLDGEKQNHSWWNNGNADAMPEAIVKMIFSTLEEIIASIGDRFPEAELMGYFARIGFIDCSNHY